MREEATALSAVTLAELGCSEEDDARKQQSWMDVGDVPAVHLDLVEVLPGEADHDVEETEGVKEAPIGEWLSTIRKGVDQEGLLIPHSPPSKRPARAPIVWDDQTTKRTQPGKLSASVRVNRTQPKTIDARSSCRGKGIVRHEAGSARQDSVQAGIPSTSRMIRTTVAPMLGSKRRRDPSREDGEVSSGDEGAVTAPPTKKAITLEEPTEVSLPDLEELTFQIQADEQEPEALTSVATVLPTIMQGDGPSAYHDTTTPPDEMYLVVWVEGDPSSRHR